MSQGYSLDTYRRIYNDTNGEYLEVCPDADCASMVELRQCSSDGKILTRVVVDPGAVEMLIQALRLCNADLNKETE